MTKELTLAARKQKAEAAALRKAEKGREELVECGCGCGVLANKGRRFRSGHDARHLGNLLRSFDGGNESAAVELMGRGWRGETELADRTEKRETKAKRQADREAAKAKTHRVAGVPRRPRPAGCASEAGRNRRTGREAGDRASEYRGAEWQPRG